MASRVQRRVPAQSVGMSTVRDNLLDLKAVAGLIFLRCVGLGDAAAADQIGYLAQRVETHASNSLRAIDGEPPGED